MKQTIGLNPEELEQIFANINAGNDLSDKIYKAYAPIKSKYAQKYDLSNEVINDLFDDVFCNVYSNVLSGCIKPSEFGIYFMQLLTKQSMFKQSQPNFNSEMLSMAYAKHMPSREAEETRKAQKNEMARQSLMYVIEVLNEMVNDSEFAAENGLNAEKIAIIKDHYGINKERKSYSLAEIAEKYNMTEDRAKAVLVVGLKKLRDMKDFAPIKAQLKR
ncbi:MAG: hypothetical protein ACLRFE_04620 [Clostridia bacterium]